MSNTEVNQEDMSDIYSVENNGTLLQKETNSMNDQKIDDLNHNKVNIDEKDNENKEKNKKNFLKEIVQMIIYFLVIIAIVGFIYNYVGQRVEVSGMSMESTLKDKDQLVLEKLSYRFGEPKRFDIIVFRPYEESKDIYYIKRIIGLPGETVQIIGSDIYINDKKLDENYGKEAIVDGGIAEQQITLGNDEYFVMGDNRNNSKDSRFAEVGNVHKDSIMGRVLFRLWPLRSIGILKHQ